MRKLILLAAISFAATIMVAADLQPLNVKPGLWQVTTTTTIQGMAAPMTATYKSCVPKDNVTKYPFPDRDNECKYNVQTSTSSHMEVDGNCLYQNGEKANFRIQLDVIDRENAQGSGQAIIAGPSGAMHGEYTGKGKWIAASCPAGME